MASLSLGEIGPSKQHRTAVLKALRELRDMANLTYFARLTRLGFWSLLFFVYFTFIPFSTHSLDIDHYLSKFRAETVHLVYLAICFAPHHCPGPV